MKLFEYARCHKLKTALFFIIMLPLSFLAPLKSFIMQWLIDSTTKSQAIRYLFIGCVLAISIFVLETAGKNIFTDFICQSVALIRTRIISRFLSSDMETYQAEGGIELISVLTNDLRIIYDDYFTSVFYIIFYGLMMVFALCMYAYISPLLLILVIMLSIIPLYLPGLLNVGLRKRRDDYSEAMADYTANIRQLVDGFETIYNYKVQESFGKAHTKYVAKTARSEFRFQKLMNYTATMPSFLSNVTFLIILMTGMFLVLDGKITLGYMVAATNLSNFVITPVQVIAQYRAKLKSSSAVREKVIRLMEVSYAVSQTHLHMDEPITSIEISNLSFKYPGQKENILKNVNLSIGPSAKIAVIGKSGSGKSTLAKLICKYYEDYQGSIRMNQIDLRQISRTSLYEQVGYISQRNYVFHDTIRNNICLYETFSEQQLRVAVEKAGIADFVYSIPMGVDTVISDLGANFSGGQIQRIVLARLLIRSYRVIIADEVTANLDVASSEQIMENLLDTDGILIAITHDTKGKFMDRFDQICHI